MSHSLSRARMLGRKRCDVQIQTELLFSFRVSSTQPNAKAQRSSLGGYAGGAACRFLGEVLPDQEGRSDRQFPSDPAIGNIIGWARSWGPFATVDVVPALK